MNLKVNNVVTEYKANPIGLGIIKPRFSWKIKSDENNVLQTAYRIQVSCEDINFVEKNIVWDTNKVESDESIHIQYDGGELLAEKKYYLRVMVWDNYEQQSSWSEAASFEMGILNNESWKAKWIADENNDKEDECPILTKQFSLGKKIKRARLYITARGLYDAKLNNTKVGDSYLTPGYTSYNKRLQYQVYDIGKQLKNGSNVIAITLATGWYSGRMVWADKRKFFGDQPALLAQMRIDYTDGTSEFIVTDESWKCLRGPIINSSIYDGEMYDANLELPDLFNSESTLLNTNSVKIMNFTNENICSTDGVEVKKMKEIKPIQMITTPKNEKVIDMGQNMVGWLRIKLKGKKGDKLELQFGEILTQDGNFYNENLRSAKATDTFILSGEEKFYEPTFTFHGFRYVKVIYDGVLDLEDIMGIVVYSEIKETGDFICSNPLLNQLQQNIQWGQRGNFVDVPTDCPQRDERLGWTGDAQVFVRTACFNMNVGAFFAKWLKDVEADQRSDGAVPHVVPNMVKEDMGIGYGSSGWGDAAVICPWTIYQCYGDKEILKNQYSSMKSWIEYMRNNSTNFIWEKGFHFGDWLALDVQDSSHDCEGRTPKEVVATAFFAYSTSIMAKMSRILDIKDDAEEYEKLHKSIKDAFISEFVTKNGRVDGNTQTAYVLALYFDLLPEELKSKAVERLEKNIISRGNHLSTGFLGTPYLNFVLSENGKLDLAYKLLEQETYPSWLYPVKKGATTIWERWDGIKENGDPQTIDMNSYNHYAYGAIGSWMYQKVAGIDLDDENTGYKHIVIKPNPGGTLTFAKASLESMYGEIYSAWEIKDGEFILKVKIPHNTIATIYLPSLTCEGDLLVNNQIQKSNENVFEVGSGEYKVLAKLR